MGGGYLRIFLSRGGSIMDTYKVEDGRIVKETICTLPGGESGAGEWCKEYCMFYGSGRCHYDPDFKRMVIRGL